MVRVDALRARYTDGSLNICMCISSLFITNISIYSHQVPLIRRAFFYPVTKFEEYHCSGLSLPFLGTGATVDGALSTPDFNGPFTFEGAVAGTGKPDGDILVVTIIIQRLAKNYR